jgi:hypothetical protein
LKRVDNVERRSIVVIALRLEPGRAIRAKKGQRYRGYC